MISRPVTAVTTASAAKIAQASASFFSVVRVSARRSSR